MSSLAHAALAASIALSALGAIVICLLTAVYGFTPPDEEPPERVTRRRLLTRIGHAVAATCFAATAIMLGVVLARPWPGSSGRAADARVPELKTRLEAQIERLAGVEARMKDSERTLERLESEVSDIVAAQQASLSPAPRPAAVKTPPPPRTEERRRAVATPPKRATRPEPTSAAASPTHPPRVPAPAPSPAAPPPLPSPPPAASPPSGAAASGPPPAWVHPPAPPHDASPPRELEQPAAPSAPPPPPVASRARDAAPPAPAADLRSKVQNDWRTIRRGVETAGDDFRRALDRLRQQLTE